MRLDGLSAGLCRLRDLVADLADRGAQLRGGRGHGLRAGAGVFGCRGHCDRALISLHRGAGERFRRYLQFGGSGGKKPDQLMDLCLECPNNGFNLALR